MLSHWLGLIGECLNFLGAVVMALDIFLHRREQRLERKLDRLASFARSNLMMTTTYGGYRLSSDDFTQNVIHRRSLIRAYGGVTLFALGFLLLVAHHGLEIRDAHLKESCCVSMNVGFVTIFRMPDTIPLKEQFHGNHRSSS